MNLNTLKTIDLEVLPPKPAAIERPHHPYSPSRLAYLKECSGFTNRQRGSAASDEGTMLHELMEELIVQCVDQKKSATLVELLSQFQDRVTEEQMDCLRYCCQHVDKFLAKKPSAVFHEIVVHTTRVNGSELNSGYLDLFMVFGDLGILIDFKFGRVPVTPAKDNLQGWNYMIGLFQKHRAIKNIGICFLQPRTNSCTHKIFSRTEEPRILKELESVVDFAMKVQADKPNAHLHLKPGKYCEYCALSGSCTAQANMRGLVASRVLGLPQPPSFVGLELNTPQDIALARYWVDILEPVFDEVKKRANEWALATGDSLSCKLPNGEEITYTIHEKKCDRSVGNAVEVADAFKDTVSLEEILGAADLGLGKLKTILENSLTEAARARGEKLTKKAAWEQAEATLTALGLISRPDGSVKYLKLQKTKTETATKQIGDTNGKSKS